MGNGKVEEQWKSREDCGELTMRNHKASRSYQALWGKDLNVQGLRSMMLVTLRAEGLDTPGLAAMILAAAICCYHELLL